MECEFNDCYTHSILYMISFTIQSNDSARSQKVQELVSTLQQSALQGLCSTQSQQCSYDITNPSFDCTDGTESNTVTFTASIEVQSNGSDGSVTADNAVSRINSWKVYAVH